MKSDRWAEIQALFHDALAVEPEQREALLSQADPQLRAEVTSLLQAHYDDPDFLEAPLTNAEWMEDAAVERIGPYQLVRPLGEGGMGRVYLARQETDAFTRFVALKVVKRGMDTEEVLRRFDAERRILASLRHSNIAQFLDAGATADGRPYFVMEFVDGERIDDWVSRTQPPLRQRLSVLRTLCGAVQHAHQNLVLHRDIKPGNVLIDIDGTPKLVDFGIGRLLDPAADGTRTHAAARRLTPEYAAPEQFGTEVVTTAADVYSLGVLLFELLTDQRPWQDDRTVDSVTPRPSDVVTQDDARPLAERTRLRRTLRGDLDNIVAMAMHPEPARRYASAAALASDLERYLAGRTVRARADSWGYRTAKFVTRNPWLVATAATLLIGSTTFAATARSQARTLERERDKAREVQGFLLETFGASTAEGAEGDSVSVRQLLDSQTEVASVAFDGDPELQGAMLGVLADAYERLGLYERADSLARVALDLHQQVHTGDHADVAAALNLLGWVEHQRGELDEAVQHLQASVSMWRRLSGEGEEGLSRALNDLGSVHDQAGRMDEAEPLLREALALRSESAGPLDRSVAITSSNLAVLHYRRGEYAAADSLGQMALDALRASVGPDHRRTFIAQSNLATFRWVAGDLDGAAVLHEDLLERHTRTSGGRNARTASAMVAYASLMRAQNRHAEAAEMLSEALVIQMEVFGSPHRDIGNTARILGVVLQRLGRNVEALASFEHALAVHREVFEAGHPLIGEALVGVAIANAELGGYPAAVSALEEAIGVFEAQSGPNDDRTADARLRLVEVLIDAGRDEEAAYTLATVDRARLSDRLGARWDALRERISPG